MPLPFIIGGIAAVAGLAGAGSAVRGGMKMKEANDTVKSSQSRHNSNVEKLKEKEKESKQTMDDLGKRELEILDSFEKFSAIFEKIKNKPKFEEIILNGVKFSEYNPSTIKEVSVGAAVILGGLGGAALGTAGGFAAAGATTAAVMALGTASTGTAIASLSGAAATNATLAALGGGAIGSSSLAGGMALGQAVLGGATLGVGLLVGGIIFNVTGSKLSDKADEAWAEMKKAEKKINEVYAYLDDLQTIAERYIYSLNSVDKVYTDHLSKLDMIVNTYGKDDWNYYSTEEKMTTQNTVLLVQLLYNMCRVKLVLKDEDGDGMENINKAEASEQLNNAKIVCSAKGFDYKEEMYDICISKEYDSYYTSTYSLCKILPINESEARDIGNALENNSKIKLFENVTPQRAEIITNKIDDKCSLSGVVISKEKSSDYNDIPSYKKVI